MLIIDSPITPWHPEPEIQTWVDELERRLLDPKYSEGDRKVIQRNLDRAKSWLPAQVESQGR